ncbi:hypothetical protein [Prosthecochloris sp. CIB 2401]|uniref:hypothetical protein n=1 Tax=Prosthecochloris sp. CIB 2401 TaxID=1868325 RepID=UPI0012EAECCA|nr:hypothetical protein [Prosthecochloris sp. CIB 2401]
MRTRQEGSTGSLSARIDQQVNPKGKQHSCAVNPSLSAEYKEEISSLIVVF